MTRPNQFLVDCPYCGTPLADAAVNDDHIFVKAKGGRAVVRVHVDCNSRLGQLVEGALMRPSEQLNIKTLRGHVDGDRAEPVEVNLETGEVMLRPVSTVDDPDAGTRTYTLRGDPDAARRRLEGPMGRKLGLSANEIDDLIKNAALMTEPINVVAELRFDLGLAQRLVAKVALGVLGRTSPATVGSPLATRLRSVLWGHESIGSKIDPEALDVFVDLMRRVGASIAPLGPQPQAEGGRAPSRAVFVPIGTSTAIFVYLGDMLLSFSGVVIEETCPVGSGLPFLVVDAKGGIQVRHIAEELAMHVSRDLPNG